MGKTKPKTKDIIKMSEDHLIYEIEMLHDTSKLILDRNLQNNISIRNAVIESFAIHLRVLLKFFFDKKPYPTDFNAIDFFDSRELWDNICNEIIDSKKLQYLCKRVDKHVAHLTYDRLDVTPEEKDWSRTRKEAFEILKLAYEKFLLNAPDESLCEQFKKEKLRLNSYGKDRT